MNLSNQSVNNASLNDKTFMDFVVNFTALMGYYIIPSISIIGSLLNLISLIVLSNVKFREQFRFIIVKIAVELVGTLIGIGYQNYLICIIDNYVFGIECTEVGSYIFQLARIFFYKYLSVVIYFWSATNEIMLTIDRYLILKDIKNWFNKPGSFKYIVLVNGILALSMYTPYLFSNQIILVNNSTDQYYLRLTEFGTSTESSMFALIMHGLMNIVLIMIVMPISILVVIEFRKFVKKHSTLIRTNPTLQLDSCSISIKTNRGYVFKKTEANMIKMTITLSVFLVLLRFCDLITTTLYRYSIVSVNISGVRTNLTYKLFLVILGNMLYLIIFSQAGMSFFVLLAFNKQFRKSFKSIYLEKKVRQVKNYVLTNFT